VKCLGDLIKELYRFQADDEIQEKPEAESAKREPNRVVEIVMSSAWRLSRAAMAALSDVFYSVNGFPMPWIASTNQLGDDTGCSDSTSNSTTTSIPGGPNAITMRCLEIREFCESHLRPGRTRWVAVDDLALDQIQRLEDIDSSSTLLTKLVAKKCKKRKMASSKALNSNKVADEEQRDDPSTNTSLSLLDNLELNFLEGDRFVRTEAHRGLTTEICEEIKAKLMHQDAWQPRFE